MDIDTDSMADNPEVDLPEIDVLEELTPSDIPDEDDSDRGDKKTDDKAKVSDVDYDKQIRNLQSLHDKQFAEQKAENAKLAGMVEALTKTQSSVSDASLRVQDQKEQEAFNREWSEKIEENPGKAVEYYQQMARELNEMMNAQLERRLDERINALNIDDKIRQLRPGWKENQAKVDEYVKKYGVTQDVALQMVNDFSAKTEKSTSQPERQKAPGRVDEGRTAGRSDDIQPMELSAMEVESLKNAGLDDKAILRIRKQMTKEATS
jgi:hypothetical protein